MRSIARWNLVRRAFAVFWGLAPIALIFILWVRLLRVLQILSMDRRTMVSPVLLPSAMTPASILNYLPTPQQAFWLPMASNHMCIRVFSPRPRCHSLHVIWVVLSALTLRQAIIPVNTMATRFTVLMVVRSPLRSPMQSRRQ